MKKPNISRRTVLATGAGLAGLPLSGVLKAAESSPPLSAKGGAVAIASVNGLRTVAKAYQEATGGMRPVSAAIQGVAIVEADPNDISVGYGGLPNERGVVQLDAACMDGIAHNAGSVACIENIIHPAQVAEIVMDHTDHVNLVGQGAKEFALSYGFPEENLLTDRARKIWLKWRASHSSDDDWLSPSGDEVKNADFERLYGTIHCSVLSPDGDVGCTTTTSGLSFKIPGRIGDSPLIGCGLYCDNEVGSAGATGRGESAIHSGGSWLVVERMRAGDTPEEACLYALKRVVSQVKRQRAWQPGLWNEKQNRPSFNLSFYAIRRDGLFGSARMISGGDNPTFAVCDSKGARLVKGSFLFES
ncbi:MAG: N(4)-(beta-N-acetylglucosaminyl)-L-asparaginase [Planctomycetota bacterium]|nr:N(4)-(beta-N-acetylglucosaminyl)-L-asparaginase [Planctomycetota bacterium]